MSILRAKKVLENELQIIELSSLLVKLRHVLVEKFPTESPETIDWALQAAITRLSTAVTHDFGVSSMPEAPDI